MPERAFVFAELVEPSPERMARLLRLTTEYLHGDARANAVGAGVLISAARTGDAVTIARSLARAASASREHPPMRIGIDVTSETILDGDMFAATRNIASRVSSVARPGDIVCTETVAETALAHGLASAVALGTFRLGEDVPPVALYVLTNRVDDSDQLMHFDPVCGKPINAEGKQITADYDGAEFYLCSEHCASLFDQTPERYLLQVSPATSAVRHVHESARRIRVGNLPRTAGCRGIQASRRTRRPRSRARRRRFTHGLFVSVLYGLASILDERLLALI